jgi:hypothetical protein
MMRCDFAVRRLIAALSAASLLVGCAHVRSADPTAAGVDLDDINAKLAGRTVRVRLTDDTVLVAHNVSVSADSLFARPPRLLLASLPWPARVARALPISEVSAIEVTRRGRGAFEGTLIGLGVGSVAGVALGAATFDPGDDLTSTTGDAALLGGFLFGVLGTGLGLLIGVGAGSTDVYDLTRVPGATGSVSPGE